jgi:clan AA aspartic protease (TIGR02281 family)
MKHLIALLLLVATPVQAEPSHVKLSPAAGTWHVEAEVDGALTAPFMVDSGAAVVVLTADLYARLRAAGAIRDSDLRAPQSFTIADGTVHQWPTFMLRSLTVGGVTIENVHAAAKPGGQPLLGQAFLERLKAWHFDNVAHELVLEPRVVPRAADLLPLVPPRAVAADGWVVPRMGSDTPVAPRAVATERVVVPRQPDASASDLLSPWVPRTVCIRYPCTK